LEASIAEGASRPWWVYDCFNCPGNAYACHDPDTYMISLDSMRKAGVWTPVGRVSVEGQGSAGFWADDVGWVDLAPIAKLVSQRRIWAGVILHEHVHRVDHLYFSAQKDDPAYGDPEFDRGNERMKLFDGADLTFNVAATEWRAAFVQARYYGDSPCRAAAFAGYYARRLKDNLKGATNNAIFARDSLLCNGSLRTVNGDVGNVSRVAVFAALLGARASETLQAMVDDGSLNSGTATFLHEWMGAT